MIWLEWWLLHERQIIRDNCRLSLKILIKTYQTRRKLLEIWKILLRKWNWLNYLRIIKLIMNWNHTMIVIRKNQLRLLNQGILWVKESWVEKCRRRRIKLNGECRLRKIRVHFLTLSSKDLLDVCWSTIFSLFFYLEFICFNKSFIIKLRIFSLLKPNIFTTLT